ncbi:MAG: response regulator transcription factor [Bacteroidales bacterium]|nr:response regulator transcription factor [Bacteroidales bacterium]
MSSSSSLGHILVVDDDPNITELLSVNLRSEGYSVSVVDCAEAVDRSEQDETRLVIVDSMNKPYSGMDLIFDFKDDPQTEHIGIILYSSFKSERMVIDALDAGADDYVVKPFSLREMIARIKSVLRRHSARPKRGNIITFHEMTVDLATQAVKINDQPITLSNKEYALLILLLKNADNYVPRVEIFRKVWSDDTAGANERIVDTNISRLRKKLGANIGARIVNRSGHGYMIS